MRLPEVVGCLDSWFTTGNLPERHHVVGGTTGVAGPDTIHSGHLEGVHREGLKVGDVIAGLRRLSGDHLRHRSMFSHF